MTATETPTVAIDCRRVHGRRINVDGNVWDFYPVSIDQIAALMS